MTDREKQEWLVKFRQTLEARFNEGELRTLCFDLGIDYDDLPGRGRADKARELVACCDRQGRLAELAATMADQRADIPPLDVPPEIDQASTDAPVSADALLAACQSQVERVSYGVRHKYNPSLYVSRAIERELNAFFDAVSPGAASDPPGPHCYLLVAPAGSGKTNLLCELARGRKLQQPVLLLLSGSLYLSGRSRLLGAIQSELEAADPAMRFHSPEECLHTLDRLSAEMNRDTLLLLDAINEYGRPAPMRKALQDLLERTRRGYGARGGDAAVGGARDGAALQALRQDRGARHRRL